METKALRLYGKNDLRFETFELPNLLDNELRLEVVCDSLCMSTYKALIQGEDHKRVPVDCGINPVMVGHECCGRIVEIGNDWRDKYEIGQVVSMQPAHMHQGTLDAPGYSYQYCGGTASYMNIRWEIMAMDCLVPYNDTTYFYGSLAEPMSCIINGFHSMYHREGRAGDMVKGIKKCGKLAVLAAGGPMGLGAIDYAINGQYEPELIVVTDIDKLRLDRAAQIYSVEAAKKKGIELIYTNTKESENPSEHLMALSKGEGFDDVIVFAPVAQVIEEGNRIMAKDGCLNLFAGPTSKDFSASVNMYDIHYSGTHIIGSVGGSAEDMREAIELMNSGVIDPASMITHVGGLNSAKEATENLPFIKGGKKLIYTQIEMPLFAIEDLVKLSELNPFFETLVGIVEKNNGLWCGEAEKYLLKSAKHI